MKQPFAIIAFILLANFCFAQVQTDSLQQKLQEKIELPQLPDSIKATWLKVDSLRTEFNNSADSLKNKFQNSVGSIDAKANAINHTIDSLENLKLPANKFTKKLDSLNQERKKAEADFNAKSNKLKSKTLGKIDKVEMTPGLEGPVKDFTGKVNGFDISSNEFVKIPPIDISGYTLPRIDGTNGLSSLTDLSNVPGMPKIETPMGDLKSVAGEVKDIQEDVKGITGGNLNDVQQLPKTLESQAGKVEGIAELQKQSAELDALKNQVPDLNDPNAVKEQAATMIKKEALNHFAGKEEVLKTAMEQMSKYKSKFSSVSSIKDLPKRLPNAMKGKPFIERLVPGVYLQVQRQGAWLLDVNPYAGYKLSGRFTTGLGWNQRFAYENHDRRWISRSRIFGPRMYVDFLMGKGFVAHLESEYMNSFVPSTLRGNPDFGKREWVWGMMAGLKKTYKIYKNLNGTVLLQYNIFDRYYKAPYIDRINSRMGFEYILKKKMKPKGQ